MAHERHPILPQGLCILPFNVQGQKSAQLLDSVPGRYIPYRVRIE